MAYSDYGAFVYMNDCRRPDKEDVGVFDTEEASLPSGLRIYANIMKNMENGEDRWWKHSHHGVMGDGDVRVACYKQGWPEIWVWEAGEAEPTQYDFDGLSRRFGWDDFDEYGGSRFALDSYDKKFDLLGWHFRFWGDECDSKPAYGASMTRDGETWECEYDCEYGAGFDD
ncbi:hypothetical protein DXD59_00655 [Olsenella sp. TM06-36]|nr:hypothetical protein DXD59_00655 [Olsenella sp. TM06-36]